MANCYTMISHITFLFHPYACRYKKYVIKIAGVYKSMCGSFQVQLCEHTCDEYTVSSYYLKDPPLRAEWGVRRGERIQRRQNRSVLR